MIEQFSSSQFWITAGQIVAISVALSGDNAIVIALAARSVLPERRRQAIIWGTMAAIAIRLPLTVVAFEMLRIPFMKILGGMLLLWIAVQFLVSNTEDHESDAGRSAICASAGYIIMLANLAMSLDNVLGVAAAAADDRLMLGLGLIISILIMLFGSTFFLKIMTRFPINYTLCAALIGYITGDMLVSDVVIKGWVDAHFHWLQRAHLGDLSFSLWGLVGTVSVFAIASLYRAWASRRGDAGVQQSKIGQLTAFGRDRMRFVGTSLAGSNILTLLPFAAVLAVVFLGHPFYTYAKNRFVPPISYSDLKLGMTREDVIKAKGYPIYVVENSMSNRKQLLIAIAEIPRGKTLHDYVEWEFPLGPETLGSIEIIFSKKTGRLAQIGCYSRANDCPPISGVSTSDTENEVRAKLGNADKVELKSGSAWLDYPHLYLSVLLANNRVVMLKVRDVASAT